MLKIRHFRGVFSSFARHRVFLPIAELLKYANMKFISALSSNKNDAGIISEARTYMAIGDYGNKVMCAVRCLCFMFTNPI